MRTIPQYLKDQISTDPFYRKCCRASDGCKSSRITIEHSMIYAGKQVSALWALLPLCEYHHSVNAYKDNGDLNKEMNIWIALNRAKDYELENISKATNYKEVRNRLNKKYGKPKIIG